MIETFEYFSPDEASTVIFGRKLAQMAKQGDVFALFGTLGMGKSVLARAFIQSLTGTEEVPSPTFTLVQSYDAPDFEIFHYDLYRIKSPEEIFEIGMEEAVYQGVSLIEWPEMMGGYLPRNCFRVEITPQKDGRKITISTASEEKRQRLAELEKDK
ncbi:MAG: tRNA (adenosine(37)-N6)-threonylcarbamoyltransferase complex ATPase subunit type 1 TsaE [Alphaproteobacteria bacterium]|nr:tRNA (adenosine(37)-N6)-threonylcarbamoyltransferase complex ATPase subunit type 1 TsaE [Alphaproteobacteria bacterium]